MDHLVDADILIGEQAALPIVPGHFLSYLCSEMGACSLFHVPGILGTLDCRNAHFLDQHGRRKNGNAHFTFLSRNIEHFSADMERMETGEVSRLGAGKSKNYRYFRMLNQEPG